MTSVQEQGRPAQKNRASEAPTDWFNNRDHENPLKSNKPGLPKASEAPMGPFKTLKPPTRLFVTLLLVPLVPDVAQYIQKDIDHLFQTFF